MSVTIPLLTAIPSSSTMNESEYNTAWNTLLSELDPYANGANALAAEVEANAADAAAAVASLAAAKWVSGAYTEGDVAWSPTDYFNYRCKNTGSRTTDPALDPTNWALQTKTGAGGADTASSAVDVTLTSTSGRLQIIAMTAAGKKVTQPAANTLQTGAPIFVYKNTGTYRFSVHKNGGGFLCYVNPGQVVMAHCSDISSGAGVWHVSGQNVDQIYGGNTAEVLNAVSSTYLALAMLSATKAICVFRNNSTTYLNAVILNYGSSSGAPSAINAEASLDISIAAQTSSQATVTYKTSTGVTKGYVLDVSGNTITPGTVATIDATAGGTGTFVTALSSTQLLCVYQNVGSNTPRQRVLDISASAITASSEVVANATNATNVGLIVRKISATKAIVGHKNASDSQLTLRLQSISGSTPAATGSELSLVTGGTAVTAIFGLIVLNANRAIVIQAVDRTYADAVATLLDISGTSPVVLRHKQLNVGLGNMSTGFNFTASRIDDNAVYVTWTGGGSFGIDAMIINADSQDRLVFGTVADNLEPGVTSTTGAVLSCASLDSTHIMQVCRNSSTYLSAKTIELAA